MNQYFVGVISCLFVLLIILITFAPAENGIVESVTVHSRGGGDDYGTPLCSKDGGCRESSTEPTPRTVFSVRSPQQMAQWIKTQNHNRRKAEAVFRKSSVDVLFLGDSITEYLTGTSLGQACCDDQKRSFDKAWVGSNVLALGLSGDQTQHLLWRISGEGGELNVGEATTIKRVVINIGTNNLGVGMTPSMAADGVVKVVETVTKLLPNAEVWVEQIFPRGRLQQSVASANARIRNHINSRMPSSVRISTCGKYFVNAEVKHESEASWTVDRAYLPDELHPNGPGVKLWMDCLKSDMNI
ncbi:hypothetical protein TrLO_g6651 [Triparma laevis f. longispina]|uniref:SGNH hydrolase-type esterase domain-containing protein n=1 Tax=Triparma laevis f. longispina TaxID=1714387 RepID=A0A9W7AAR7_9STRA|nr:hypothetical protein TrLO_g6651 [Triparma laevis f. longispina]